MAADGEGIFGPAVEGEFNFTIHDIVHHFRLGLPVHLQRSHGDQLGSPSFRLTPEYPQNFTTSHPSPSESRPVRLPRLLLGVGVVGRASGGFGSVRVGGDVDIGNVGVGIVGHDIGDVGDGVGGLHIGDVGDGVGVIDIVDVEDGVVGILYIGDVGVYVGSLDIGGVGVGGVCKLEVNHFDFERFGLPEDTPDNDWRTFSPKIILMLGFLIIWSFSKFLPAS